MDVHDEFFELLLHTMISSTDDAAQARDKLIKLRDWLLNNVPSKLYRFRIYIHIMQIPVFFLRPGLAAVGIPLGPALFALLLRLLAFLALALKDGAVGLQRAVVEHHFQRLLHELIGAAVPRRQGTSCQRVDAYAQILNHRARHQVIHLSCLLIL